MRNKAYNVEVSYEIVIEALSQEDARRIIEESMSEEQKLCFNIRVTEFPSNTGLRTFLYSKTIGIIEKRR